MPTQQDLSDRAAIESGVQMAQALRFGMLQSLAMLATLFGGARQQDKPAQAPPRRADRWQPQPTDEWDDPRS